MSNRVEPLIVIAPSSVESWYAKFARNDNPVLFIGEEEHDHDTVLRLIKESAEGRPIVIYSGHDSLTRDYVLGWQLRKAGMEVASQSGFASAAGIDKLLQKRILGAAGIPVPIWGVRPDAMPPGLRILSKRRASTQSRGLGWAVETPVGSAHTYWEEFVPGVEYSVVIYRDNRGTTFFPIVWKGEARVDLLPPWRRLRTVPSGLDADTASALVQTAGSIADLFEVWGFMEVEFIVPAVGKPLVIDINPRICGVLRLVAMASGARIFDWAEFPYDENRVLSIVRHAAEVPFDGTPFVSEGIIGTSRLTCSGESAVAVKQLLASRADVAYLKDSLWPAVWHED